MKYLILALLFASAAHADPVADWKANMLNFGQKNCDYVKTGIKDDAHMGALYYDGQRVFFHIYDFTGDPKWADCAKSARAAYRDYYVLPNGGRTSGIYNFSQGLAEDCLRNKEAQSCDAVKMLAANSVWCTESAYNTTNLKDPNQQRENAYCGMSAIDSGRVGAPKDSKVYLENALLHLERQFVKKDALYIKPFMFSLAGEFLERYYYEVQKDARIIPALKNACDILWVNFWKEDAQAMLYVDQPQPGDDPSVPAPDLNLLIAPVYSFVCKESGDRSYCDKAGKLFAGGVAKAFLAAGKQFNQNYRNSFKYVSRINEPFFCPVGCLVK